MPFKRHVGVANGKIETLRDGETSVFLCETDTFEISEMRGRDFRVYKLRDRDFSSNSHRRPYRRVA